MEDVVRAQDNAAGAKRSHLKLPHEGIKRVDSECDRDPSNERIASDQLSEQRRR